MEGVGIGNGVNPANLAGVAAPKTEIVQKEVSTQRVAEVKENPGTNIELKDQESARFDAVRKAARKVVQQQNPFPVSDVRFTIYKDRVDSGEFIFVTRFTSLKDGKVTIIPENSIIASVGKGGGDVVETVA